AAAARPAGAARVRLPRRHASSDRLCGGRRPERRGPRPGAVRARTPPDDRRHAAAAQADQPRRTPDPGDARPARVLARLVGRGPEGHEGTLSEAPLARGAVGRAPEPEDE